MVHKFTNNFGGPEVKGEQERLGGDNGVSVNVPASGEVRLTPEEARQVAKFMKQNQNNMFFSKFFTGDSTTSEIANALEDAADYAEGD